MNSIEKIKKAKMFGVVGAVMVVVTLGLSFFVTAYYENASYGILYLVDIVTSLALTFLYALFLDGVKEIAKISGNSAFKENVKLFYWASLVTGVIAAFLPPGPVLNPIVGVVFAVVLAVVLGLVSIRISKGFKEIERYGKYSSRAAKWHKVTGYLMVTIIFSPIGALTSLIADFYMWKVLSEHLRQVAVKQST